MMTGMEFFEATRRSVPGATGRIIFLSGGAFTTAAREFIESVSNLVLEKPIDFSALRARIAERVRAGD